MVALFGILIFIIPSYLIVSSIYEDDNHHSKDVNHDLDKKLIDKKLNELIDKKLNDILLS